MCTFLLDRCRSIERLLLDVLRWHDNGNILNEDETITVPPQVPMAAVDLSLFAALLTAALCEEPAPAEIVAAISSTTIPTPTSITYYHYQLNRRQERCLARNAVYRKNISETYLVGTLVTEVTSGSSININISCRAFSTPSNGDEEYNE